MSNLNKIKVVVLGGAEVGKSGKFKPPMFRYYFYCFVIRKPLQIKDACKL